MGFWDSFKTSRYAFREFTDQVKRRRLSFSDIDSVINQLHGWKREFEALDSEARRERNPLPALNELSGVQERIDNKIEQLYQFRTKLAGHFRATEEQIRRCEENLGRMRESLSRDRDRFLGMRPGTARQDCYQRVQDKQRRVDEMEESLRQLRQKMSEMGPG